MAKWTTCIVGRGTSSKRGDGGRSLVPMTPEGTSRESEEASVTPAVKLGSAAIISLVVGSATPALIVYESAKRGTLLRGPPARGPCHGSDRWPTESTLQRKANHRTYCPPSEMVCSCPRAISNDQHATTSTRSDCCPRARRRVAAPDSEVFASSLGNSPRGDILMGEANVSAKGVDCSMRRWA